MRVRLSLTISLVWAYSIAIGAHGVDVHSASDPRVFSVWDQATLAALFAFAALYALGVRRLIARGARPSYAQLAMFSGGWLAVVTAAAPWIDAAALARFSAHMAQHELMILVGAPLLIGGRPLSICLWGLPSRWRHGAATLISAGRLPQAVRVATAPAIAWALHGAALWIWHLPALYDLAVQREPVHALQHASFVGTSLLFWGGLLNGRYGRAGYGAATFFVFTTAVHTGLLGALLAIAPAPLYSVYATLPGVDSASAIADQQLAGLVMWIPAGLLLTVFGVALFAAWLGEAERRTRVS